MEPERLDRARTVECGLQQTSGVRRLRRRRDHSDAGVLLLREQARWIHLSERMAGCFTNHRDRERLTHALPAMLAQRVCGMALGYEDIIDHDTLRFDPALKLLASPRTGDPGTPAPLAGKSTLSRLEQSWETGNRRYHQMVPNLRKLSNLFVTLFLDVHQTPSSTAITNTPVSCPSMPTICLSGADGGQSAAIRPWSEGCTDGSVVAQVGEIIRYGRGNPVESGIPSNEHTELSIDASLV